MTVATQRARRAAKLRQRRAMLAELTVRPRRCEIVWDDRCEGTAVDPHEPLTRARGGSITDRANVVLGCRYCHDQVHAHPAEALERGLLRSSSS